MLISHLQKQLSKCYFTFLYKIITVVKSNNEQYYDEIVIIALIKSPDESLLKKNELHPNLYNQSFLMYPFRPLSST